MNWSKKLSKQRSESASDDGIRVNWRVAIISGDGEPPIFGRVQRLSQRKAVVRVDHNLMPGFHYHLALMLPKSTPDEPRRLIEGNGLVTAVVHAASEFHITFDLLEIKNNGAAMLEEQIEKYRQRWNYV